MKLKLDANGNVVLQDGKPVYIDADGKEVAYDAPAMHAKITDLNKENQKHRETAETAAAKLKTFEAIPDVALAVKALETLKNLDDKKLVDAGEVEKVKAAAVKGYEDKLTTLSTNHAAELKKVADERDGIRGQFHTSLLGGAFTGSRYVAEKLSIPCDFVQTRFEKNFKVEDGKIVGYDNAGNRLMSRSKPGDPADFEESIELLVDTYPQKDSILKGTGQTGSGKTGGKDDPVGKRREGSAAMGGDRAERTKAIQARFGKILTAR